VNPCRFQDKTVLVTGSGRGFGAVLATAFAREGANVIVHYYTSSAGAEETAAAVRALGRRTMLVQGDIAKHDDVKRITESSFAEFGHVDVLVTRRSSITRSRSTSRERCS
jgi:3-oxoacyl-[acyl-carrier protein] reductase